MFGHSCGFTRAQDILLSLDNLPFVPLAGVKGTEVDKDILFFDLNLTSSGRITHRLTTALQGMSQYVHWVDESSTTPPGIHLADVQVRAQAGLQPRINLVATSDVAAWSCEIGVPVRRATRPSESSASQGTKRGSEEGPAKAPKTRKTEPQGSPEEGAMVPHSPGALSLSSMTVRVQELVGEEVAGDSARGGEDVAPLEDDQATEAASMGGDEEDEEEETPAKPDEGELHPSSIYKLDAEDYWEFQVAGGRLAVKVTTGKKRSIQKHAIVMSCFEGQLIEVDSDKESREPVWSPAGRTKA